MKNKFYGIVSTSRKEVQPTRTKDQKGRWTTEITEVSRPVDVLVVSAFEDKMDAEYEIKQAASKMGTLKYFGAFK